MNVYSCQNQNKSESDQLSGSKIGNTTHKSTTGTIHKVREVTISSTNKQKKKRGTVMIKLNTIFFNF